MEEIREISPTVDVRIVVMFSDIDMIYSYICLSNLPV